MPPFQILATGRSEEAQQASIRATGQLSLGLLACFQLVGGKPGRVSRASQCPRARLHGPPAFPCSIKMLEKRALQGRGRGLRAQEHLLLFQRSEVRSPVPRGSRSFFWTHVMNRHRQAKHSRTQIEVYTQEMVKMGAPDELWLPGTGLSW